MGNERMHKNLDDLGVPRETDLLVKERNQEGDKPYSELLLFRLRITIIITFILFITSIIFFLIDRISFDSIGLFNNSGNIKLINILLMTLLFFVMTMSFYSYLLLKNAKSNDKRLDANLSQFNKETELKMQKIAKELNSLKVDFQKSIKDKHSSNSHVIELKRKQIDELEKSAKNTLENINKLYDIAKISEKEGKQKVLANELATEFARRKRQLTITAMSQYVIFILICITLTGLGGLHFIKYGGQSLGISDLYRLIFVSPLIYLAFFLQNQYRRNRKLIETFAFKEIIATSMSGYEKLYIQYDENLSETEKPKHTRAFKFMDDTVNKIYFEPAELIKEKEDENAIEKAVEKILTLLKDQPVLLKKLVGKDEDKKDEKKEPKKDSKSAEEILKEVMELLKKQS